MFDALTSMPCRTSTTSVQSIAVVTRSLSIIPDATMNQHASDRPQNGPDQSPASQGGQDRDAEPSGVNSSIDDKENRESEPIQASLVDTIDQASPIRVGSPFAVDPIDPLAGLPAKKIEPFLDVGPIRYTAMGAVAASLMVVGFAAAAAWWFPTGGALIAALGCVLSIFGLYSTYRFTSVGLLAIHLGLFVVSYGRSLG